MKMIDLYVFSNLVFPSFIGTLVLLLRNLYVRLLFKWTSARIVRTETGFDLVCLQKREVIVLWIKLKSGTWNKRWSYHFWEEKWRVKIRRRGSFFLLFLDQLHV